MVDSEVDLFLTERCRANWFLCLLYPPRSVTPKHTWEIVPSMAFRVSYWNQFFLLNKAEEMGRKAEFCCFCLSFKEGLFALLAKSTEVLLRSCLCRTHAPGEGVPWTPGLLKCQESEAVGGATSSSSSKNETENKTLPHCDCLKLYNYNLIS